MALIKELLGKTPEFGDNVYLAETATIIGDVKMGKDCSVWFNAVIRGDVNSIRIGNQVNIQDNAMIHCTFEKTETIIGDNVSIGHNAIVHGCQVHDNVLIGMGAIVMDDCVVENNSIVAAGAVVTQDTYKSRGNLGRSTSKKKIKSVSVDLLEGEINRISNNYIKYSSWYKED